MQRRISSNDIARVALIGLILACASILNVVVMPHHHLTVLFILAILVSALRWSPRIVAITTLVTLFLDLVDVFINHESMSGWLFWVATVIIAGFLATIVSRQRIREKQRTHEAERTAELMVRLNSIAVDLAAAVTPARVAQVVVSHASVVGARAGILVTLSPNLRDLELIASSGYSSSVTRPWERFALNLPTPLSEAVREDVPIWLGTRSASFARFPPEIFPQDNPDEDRAWAAVPLRVGDRVIGGLGLAFQEEQSFPEDNQKLLLALAAQCAQALDRSRLYEVERQARVAVENAMDQTLSLQTVTAALSEALSPHDVAKAIVKQGRQALGARAGFLGDLTSNGLTIEIVYAEGYSSQTVSEHQLLPITSPLPIAEVCRTGDPIVFRTGADRAGAYPLNWISLEDGNIGAGAAIPLIVDGRILGAFGLSFLETRELSTEDVSFALTLAHLAAQALQRSRLFEAEEAARAQAEVAVRHRDEFLAVAAHELKSPITSLLGFTQVELHWYQREVDRYPEQTGRSLEIIDLQARRLSQMIARLFDVAQIDSKKLILQPEATVLTELVGDVVRSFHNGLIQHAIVVDAVPTAKASIDQLRFEQVLTNLIDNAVKYSPEGSTIEIQVTQPCFDLVQVAVRDHGPGIVPERRGHIFERYYQADRENHRSGLGLGLYICHQIVDLHGGQIWAEFPDDGGTRIVITVPSA